MWETVWKLSDHCVVVIIHQEEHNEGSPLVPDDLDLLMTSSLRPLSSDCDRYHLMMSSMLSNVKMTSSQYYTCQRIRSAQGKHIEILSVEVTPGLMRQRVTLHVSIVGLGAKTRHFLIPCP